MRHFWVFGYGSLMWRPGFSYVRRESALLYGAHRSLCVYSHVHRGTPERPGLVLGLDHGGTCKGIAFAVEPDNWQATLDYLREREQVTMVYKEVTRNIRLASGESVPAVSYMVDRAHQQYAGKLDLNEQLSFVRSSHGQSGPNTDYVINTQAHLAETGTSDPALAWLTRQLQNGN